jgi:hypothetical protein
MKELSNIKDSKSRLTEKVDVIKAGYGLMMPIDSHTNEVVDINKNLGYVAAERNDFMQQKLDILEELEIKSNALSQEQTSILQNFKTDLDSVTKSPSRINFLNIPEFNLKNDDIINDPSKVEGDIEKVRNKIDVQLATLYNNKRYYELDENAGIMTKNRNKHGSIAKGNKPRQICWFSFIKKNTPSPPLDESPDGSNTYGLLDILKAIFPESPVFKINNSSKIGIVIRDAEMDLQIALIIKRFSNEAGKTVEDTIPIDTVRNVISSITNNGRWYGNLATERELANLPSIIANCYRDQIGISRNEIYKVLYYVQQKNKEIKIAEETYEEEKGKIDSRIANKDNALRELTNSLDKKAGDVSRAISSSLDSLKKYKKTIENLKSTDEEFVKKFNEQTVQEYETYVGNIDLTNKIDIFLSTEANKNSLLEKTKKLSEHLKTSIDTKVAEDNEKIEQLSSKETRTKQALKKTLIAKAKKEFAKIKAESEKNDYNSDLPSARLNAIKRIRERIRLICYSHGIPIR